MTDLTIKERREVAEILHRRSNEIAAFAAEYKANPDHFGSVELALSREIDRLRRLRDKLTPEEDDEA